MEQSVYFIYGSVQRYPPADIPAFQSWLPVTILYPKRRFPVPFQHPKSRFSAPIAFRYHTGTPAIAFQYPSGTTSLGFRHLSTPNLVFFRHHHFLSKARFPTSLCPNFRKYLWSSVFVFSTDLSSDILILLNHNILSTEIDYSKRVHAHTHTHTPVSYTHLTLPTTTYV